ncbi:SbcD-like subunit of palindrome specific endonuclease [Serratia phage 92A1]|nr:SbcD-like subunit of palindrome specific endonuclease [Serratia phage 92A1]
MNNTILMGDLHYGVKQDDPWIQKIQREAMIAAIEYSISKGIKVWLQAGDWFDVRKAITHTTMEFTREMIELIQKAGIHVYVLVGNHDMHYKNKIHPNAVSELLHSYTNLTVVDTPRTVSLGPVDIDLIPWICDSNRGEVLDFIKTSNSEYCMGHFELNGFYFYKGMKSHGTEPDFLKRYKQVFSGHFHTISEAANVKYIGTPFTLTAGDENDPRGIWEFNPDTLDLDFLENSRMWHRRVEYPSKINVDDYKDCSVRLIVTEIDKDLPKFETALEKVVHELRVVNQVEYAAMNVDGTEIETKGTLDLMEEHIESLDEPDDVKKALLQRVKALYIEAQAE